MQKSLVTEFPPASSQEAASHFELLLRVETDCWDVHQSMAEGDVDFVLLDVRSEQAFAEAHIPGAIHIPHPQLTAENLTNYPLDTVFVVYCAGPHCNGADKAARRLASLGRPVKKMIGGAIGWLDEGFRLAAS